MQLYRPIKLRFFKTLNIQLITQKQTLISQNQQNKQLTQLTCNIYIQICNIIHIHRHTVFERANTLVRDFELERSQKRRRIVQHGHISDVHSTHFMY